MEFLQGALAGDPVLATEVSRMACEHGLTAKAIRAAREALDVKIARDGFGPGSQSLWSLPRGHIEAPPSDEKVGASWEGPDVSETALAAAEAELARSSSSRRKNSSRGGRKRLTPAA
jgi:hypothetical protein